MSRDIEETAGGPSDPGTGASPQGPAAPAQDLALVEALRRGDEDAFAHLVDLHHATLCRIARLYVSDAAVAEEVVQDTWIVVVQGVWAFEGRSSLKTWILRILANRARTRAKREKRTISFTDLGLDDSGAPEPAPGRGAAPPRDPAPSPEASVLAEEGRRQVMRAIDALPDNLRLVLTLRDIEGVSSEETCNILGIHETNQRVLLHRARSKVRAALQSYLEGE